MLRAQEATLPGLSVKLRTFHACSDNQLSPQLDDGLGEAQYHPTVGSVDYHVLA